MLDADLAELYGVETKALVQAVKRNASRFPTDFMFQLTGEELGILRSQFVISRSWGGRRYAPYAFTEQGVAMLSSVLRSPRAIAVNIEIMRTFVRLREMLSTHVDLARKLSVLERKYDSQFRPNDTPAPSDAAPRSRDTTHVVATRKSGTRPLEELPAYAVPRAAQIVRLSPSTLRLWAIGDGDHRPLFAVSSRRPPLLSFSNLTEAFVLASMRRVHGISMQKVRRALLFVGRELGCERPLIHAKFQTDGPNVAVEL
jgi:hypothetical protein